MRLFGVIKVTVNGEAWADVWWSPNADSVTNWLPAARQHLGSAHSDTRFEDDLRAWQEREAARKAAEQIPGHPGRLVMDFLALAHQCAPAVHPQTMAAVAQVESGFNPFAIGVVGSRLQRQPRNKAEAMATAKALEQAGLNFSLGLGQVNRHNLARYGLDYDSAFDPCANLRAGSLILKECFERALLRFKDQQQALQGALSCYYSVYGKDDAQTFTTNHALQIVFPPKASETQTAKDISEWLGVISEQRLLVCVNDHDGRLFVTDGVWADSAYRAFPFNDESAALIGLARKLGWSDDADVIVDLAGGCGHSALSFDAKAQYLLDINPRALAYAAMNTLLNALDPQRYRCVLNDIREGIGSLPVDEETCVVLLVANMPFGPAPRRSDLPLTSYGGPSGMDLQVATFEALKRLRGELPARVVIRALVMGVSVGDARADRWHLHREAASHFGDRVRWIGMDEELLVRIDGRRALSNPSPVRDALPAAADCQLYNPDPDKRAERRAAYQQLAREHESHGNPDIAYGAVAVELA